MAFNAHYCLAANGGQGVAERGGVHAWVDCYGWGPEGASLLVGPRVVAVRLGHALGTDVTPQAARWCKRGWALGIGADVTMVRHKGGVRVR